MEGKQLKPNAPGTTRRIANWCAVYLNELC
jgi:hypothetical protein